MLEKIVLAVYLTTFTAFAAKDAGEPIKCVAGSTYEWWMPISVFVFLAIPAFLGYLIGSGGMKQTTRQD